MKSKFITTVLCFAVLLFGAIAANAAALTVTKIADTSDNVCDADCSLREAVFAAVSGDTIEFAASVFNSVQTITLTLGELVIDKNLTVNGKSTNLTTISGNNASRVFRVFFGGNLTLNGLTVTGGRDGGNGNKYGGGVFNGGTVSINNSILSGNTVAGGDISYGGAIYNDDNSTMTITGSSISGNALAGFATNVNCRGGGIYNAANTTVNITNSTISNNTGNTIRDNAGIGIYNQGGTLTITGSTISGNTVSNASANTNHAGGIYNTGTITLINSTISGNTAISGNFSSGGGIYNAGTVTIINGTVTRNTASSTFSRQGGGIANFGTLRAVNTIISGNTSPRDTDLYGGLAVNTNNYIGGDAKLVLLGANGGATQTHALLSDSPALNTGSSCVLTADACGFTHPFLTTDQRGANFPRLFGTAVDVGAVEDSINISPTTLPPGTRNVAYSQTLSASGNSSPYSFILDSGTLPTGITLSTSGLLSGTTTQEGTFNFAVRVTGANGLFIIRNYVLLIAYYVTNANSSGAGSLRQLVNDTPASGTIRFDPVFFSTPRTIPGGGVINIFKNLTIIGPGANLLTLDGQNTSRVFNIDNSAATLNLSGVTITQGNSGAGASAGCILIANGTLNANGIAVNSCSTPIVGGGIYNNGTLNLINSTVNGNTAATSGGIYNECGRTATITNSIISNNISSGGAGGIGSCGTLNFYDSTVHGNTATFGGGLSNGGFANFANSTISGNRATINKGGGIYNGNGNTVHLLNTTVTNNRADGFAAAGIWNENSTSTTVRARNTIIAGNISGNGNPVDYTGGITDLGNNLINNANHGLAPLGNYGGATPTHALLPNSPALNAGSDCVLTANACGITHSAYPNDQRGTNAPRKIGSSVDIGAFERSITINQTTLPNGIQTESYSQNLTATRATNFAENLLTSEKNDLFGTDSLLAPFTFSIVVIAGQSLPPGLILASNGTISGTPTQTGTFTFTVKTADTDAIAGVQTLSITIAPFNNPPTVSGATISRQAGTYPLNSQIATVNDVENGANGVSVSITSANPSNDVTVSNIVNTNGNVTANVVAACTAANATFTVRASDGSKTTDGTLTVNVSANTAPVLQYPATPTVAINNSIDILPTTVTDNGTMAFQLVGVSPAMTTAPVVDFNGGVSIVNAHPAGIHTITVRATDNCGATTDANFALNVTAPIKTVTKTDDTNDGICDADCSLREAIAAATPGDTVQFAAPLFDSAQTVALTSELSVIGKNITILGRAANLTAISGENTSRVFNVGGGSNLTLDNITVKNGRDFSTGGGIYNTATLNITNSTISNNSVSGGNDNSGGGIYNGSQATLTIRNSTISGNSVTGSGNFANRGGGIANFNGTVSITNSTVSGNSLGGGTNNRGGGIYSEYGPLNIINDTITANTIALGGFNYGGGVASSPDGAYFVNSIVSNNFATGNSDILGSYNPNSNFIGGDARLAPLGFYGGATQTHALLSDSPARNAGNNCVLTANGCPNGNPSLTTDQRGSGRIIGELVDIGAFESNITIEPGNLPNGNTLQFYSQQLFASRQTNLTEIEENISKITNIAPTDFEIVSIDGQSLPPGITLSPSGLLSGLPTMTGNYVFTVRATDTDGVAGVQQLAMQVLTPTSANVSVSGSIKTENGNSIANAMVTLTDSNGIIRKVQTGNFGYYRFDNVEAGQTYIISVSAIRFRFAQNSRVLTVSEDSMDVNFIGQE